MVAAIDLNRHGRSVNDRYGLILVRQTILSAV